MQTSFTPDQLQDPLTARSNKILRACVHCGFCTATCPTYQVLGDELDSPRGRIYLIKEMLESGRPADEKTVKHIDRCLGCLSCMTTCPSGVNYAHLVDHARIHIERTYRRPWMDRGLRWMLSRVLPYPGRFRLALRAARLARPLAGLMPDRRLRVMLGMAPTRLPAPSLADRGQVFPADGMRRGRVALMIGCAQRTLNTQINEATIRLLRRAGIEVVIPEDFGCCGALDIHMGRERDGNGHARRAIASLLAAERGGALDAVIVNTSGCGTTIKDYGHVFKGDPIEADARRVAALARDVTEYLAGLGLPRIVRATGQRVAYHSACSLQHGQQIRSAPRDLLTGAGFRVVEPADSHLCCGSAGTYNLLQPELSGALRARKVATLEKAAPQIIAAGNIGCMVQIAAGTAVPVVHTVQLLDWATGGPRPEGLETI